MYHFQVNNMTCGHCAGSVEKAVKAADANAKVKVDVPSRKVEVESEKPAHAFVAAIADAGYTAELHR